MASPSTQQLLSRLLLTIAESEKRLEVMRVVLGEVPSFDPYALFQVVGRHGAQGLTAADVKDFVENSYVTEEDVRRFVKAVDSDGDDVLSFPDFLSLLLPRTDAPLRLELLNRPSRYYRELSIDAHLAALRLLEAYIASLRSIEEDQRALTRHPHFNLLDSFRDIDTANVAYVTRSDFHVFLSAMGVSSPELYLDALMRVMDTDNDGRVSYIEFIDSVLPRDIQYRSAATGTCEYMTPNKNKPRSVSTTSAKTRKSPLTNTHKKQIIRSKTASPKKRTHKNSIPIKTKLTRRSMSKVFEEPPTIRRVLFSSKEVEIAGLAEMLVKQLELERKVEEIRENLALRLDFSIPALFSTINPNSESSISVPKFRSYLQNYLHLSLPNDHFSLLIKSLDRDKDDKIDASDISALVIPKGKEYRTVLEERDEFVRKKMNTGVFSVETVELIGELVEAVAEREGEVEGMRQEVVQRNVFSLNRAAHALDARSKGFLTASDFRRFLRNHGKCVTEAELETLMLRYDGDRDGRVSYADLMAELTPKAPRTQY